VPPLAVHRGYAGARLGDLEQDARLTASHGLAIVVS